MPKVKWMGSFENGKSPFKMKDKFILKVSVWKTVLRHFLNQRPNSLCFHKKVLKEIKL